MGVEEIISLVTIIVTLVLGAISKKSEYVNNNLIIIQNIALGIIVSIIYYVATGNISTAITLSGVFAETGYNLFHNIEKLLIQKTKEG